ncbi:MAG: OmpA family protein, partial [Rhodospirillaceae bacterium]|nr:OmpA family protein [Rhodospirillaceae bacterium]
MSIYKYITALAVAGAVALAGAVSPALADDKGFYAEGRAGASIPTDSSLDTATSNQDAELELGLATGLGIGYGYGNGFRGALEFDYHGNDVDNVGSTAASGDFATLSLMVSGYYDFFRNKKFQPYVGLGVGFAQVDADNVSPVSGSSIDDDDLAFAFHGSAGVSVALSERTKLTFTYRYFSVPDLGFTTAAGASVDSDYTSHDILVGLRYSFGAPKRMADPVMPAAAPAPRRAPAPAPAPVVRPAPAPAPPPKPITRNFLVFFDWDSSALTSQARSIVQSAASEVRRAGKARLRLTGHADRSGTNRYNQGLSMRRAVAVRGLLERLGIGRNDIAVLARGEAEPLVPTADGIREPQN